jgi:predicted MFS family arabinose efflux permease
VALKATPLLRGLQRRVAIASILQSQLISAYCNYAPSAVYSDMAKDLGLNVTGLGAITTAYFLGIGPMQVFAGILTARMGARRTLPCGIALAAASMAVTAVQNQLGPILILRFLTGVGMAFVFSPGIALMTRYLEKGSEGLGIGLFVGASCLGGIIFIPGLAVLGRLDGWRVTFLLGGAFAFIATIMLAVLVSVEQEETSSEVRISDLPRVILDRSLLVVGAACQAIQIGWSTVGSFTVFYLEVRFGLAPATAGEIASLFLLSALLVSTFSEKVRGRIEPVIGLVAAGLVSAIGLFLVGTTPVLGAAVAIVFVGAAAGVGFTTPYVLVTRINQSDARRLPLRISWVNSMSLLGGLWAPILFSYIATNHGFAMAWFVTGGISLPFLMPLLLAKSRRQI